MNTNNFYIIDESGKQKKHKFNKDEFNEYRDICLTIWGALPHDLTWALNTNLYKEHKKKLIENGKKNL